METMGSGASAPIVHHLFKLIVVFFVVPTAVAVSQPPPPLPRLLSLSLSSLLSLSYSLLPLSLSSLLSLSLSLLSSLLLSPLSTPPSPLPPPPQLPSPSSLEHSRFLCCRGARPSPARDLPHRCCCRCCRRARLSPARRCSHPVRLSPGHGPKEGVSPRVFREGTPLNQAIEPVV